MRYFNCSLCNRENVKQADIVYWRALICESCRKDNREVSKELDDQRWEKYIRG